MLTQVMVRKKGRFGNDDIVFDETKQQKCYYSAVIFHNFAEILKMNKSSLSQGYIVIKIKR